MSEAKTFEIGNPTPRPASEGSGITSTDSECIVINESPEALPAFVRYGCLGCLMTRERAGGCLLGNEVGDVFCQRDRKLNLRATDECLRKGCISAQHVENHTLVCTHITTKCECIDTLGNSYGNLQRTRKLAEMLGIETGIEAARIGDILRSRRRHPTGAVIMEVPIS